MSLLMHAAMCVQVLASSPRGAASDSAASSSLHLPDDLPGQSNCGTTTTASEEQEEEHFSLFAATSSVAHGGMQHQHMGYGGGPSSAAVPIPAPRGRLPELVRPQVCAHVPALCTGHIRCVGLQPTWCCRATSL